MDTEELHHHLAQVHHAYNSHVRNTCVCLVLLALNVVDLNLYVADLLGWHCSLAESSEVQSSSCKL